MYFITQVVGPLTGHMGCIVSSHVILNIFCPHNTISECVQRNFCSLPPLAMTSIATAYRQLDVNLFDGALKVRDGFSYL